MTVPNSDQKITYLGTGATATYAGTDIKVFDEDDLVIFVTKLSDLVITTLTINTDYTVADVGVAAGPVVTLVNASQAWLSGGFLTSSYSITIQRRLEIVQETSVTSQGQNLPEYVEKQFDRNIMISQQQQEQLDRALKLPENEPGTAANTTLPDVDTRANTIAAYDEDGNPTTAVLSSVGANAAASYVTLAADASLTNERVLTGTVAQILVTDNGPGGTVVVSLDTDPTLPGNTTVSQLTVGALHSGYVTIAGTNGLLEDDAGLTYDKTANILSVPVVAFTPGAAPSLANGQQWSDSTRIAPSYRTGGMTEYGQRIIYSQGGTGSVVVANTVVATSLLNGAQDFGTPTIAANYLTAGKSIKITAWGTVSVTGTPNCTITALLGAAGATSTLAAIPAAGGWRTEHIIYCKTAGAAGTFAATGSFSGGTSGGASTFYSNDQTGGGAARNTTGTLAVDLTVTWGTASASNSFTCQCVTIEVVG